MFGVDMRLPVEMALSRDMPAHKWPSENAEIISKQLALMRQQAQTLAQSSREQGAKMANKGKHSYEFKPGDRVCKVRDVLGNADDHKTASKFQGPYVILEKGTNDVYKLANFYTGKSRKILCMWTNCTVVKVPGHQSIKCNTLLAQTVIKWHMNNVPQLAFRVARSRWPRPKPLRWPMEVGRVLPRRTRIVGSVRDWRSVPGAPTLRGGDAIPGQTRRRGSRVP